jgi:hypothetical protein
MSYYTFNYYNEPSIVNIEENTNTCPVNKYSQLSLTIDSTSNLVSAGTNSSLPSIQPGSTSLGNYITPLTSLSELNSIGSIFSLYTPKALINGITGTPTSYILIKTSMSSINIFINVNIIITNPSSTTSNSGSDSITLCRAVGGINGPIYPLYTKTVNTNTSGGPTEISFQKHIYGEGIKSGDLLFFALSQNTAVSKQIINSGTITIQLIN